MHVAKHDVRLRSNRMIIISLSRLFATLFWNNVVKKNIKKEANLIASFFRLEILTEIQR